MLSINTILHPTDFSSSAANAFEMACSLAGQHQAKLLLLHVISPPAPPPLPYNDAGMGTIEEDAEMAYERLEEMRSAKPQLMIEYVLVEGEPEDEIVRVAKETHADLIVLGTHGRTGLEHLLMGSVAEGVTRDAPCRVITVSERAAHGRTLPVMTEHVNGV
jgi:nucleotide-binding universal stress UspA family protein